MEMTGQNLILTDMAGAAKTPLGGKTDSSSGSAEDGVFSGILKDRAENSMSGGTDKAQTGKQDLTPQQDGSAAAMISALWTAVPGMNLIQAADLQTGLPAGLPGIAAAEGKEMPISLTGLTGETGPMQGLPADVQTADLPGGEGQQVMTAPQTGAAAQQTESTGIQAAPDMSGAGTQGEAQSGGMSSQKPGVAGETAWQTARETTAGSEMPDVTAGQMENASGSLGNIVQAAVQNTDGTQQAAAAAQTQTTPTVYVAEDMSAQSIRELGELAEQAIQSSPKELEVQLEPVDLGKIIIRAEYEDGKALVSITCTTEKALEALSRHAGDIGAILKERTGEPTQVVVDNSPEAHVDQDGRNGDTSGREQQEQQGQSKRDSSQTRRTDFLEQIRLGLI
ncbi:MAG TPA: hypothetical protein H9722_03855 [Candidatus Mediterraneibacter pullistercoris]|nr:hypothetical protein [Candidatus Mediterraneibacter pullistercoris]